MNAFHQAHGNTFPASPAEVPSTAWIHGLCADFSGHSFLRKSSDDCPMIGKLAYALDRLAATAMSIPFKRKIHPPTTPASTWCS